MANKQKKPASKARKQAQKKFPVKKVIGGAVAAVLVAAAVVFIVLTSRQEAAKHVLRNTAWSATTAKNASGDEVDVRQVYNVKYTQYQGRLTFDDTNRFELWLQPGDATDGTHAGTYELTEDKAIAHFDSGETADFLLTRQNCEITVIEIAYGNYTVSFLKDKTA